jgi:hypothetical protein
MLFNAREYLRGNQNRTNQRNWQNKEHRTKKNKTKQNNAICVGHHYAKANTNYVNKT